VATRNCPDSNKINRGQLGYYIQNQLQSARKSALLGARGVNTLN
jgi:hypothetical protein